VFQQYVRAGVSLASHLLQSQGGSGAMGACEELGGRGFSTGHLGSAVNAMWRFWTSDVGQQQTSL